MPGGGGLPCPYKAAKPVEPGWGERAWYKAFNATNSRIRNAEGPAAEKTARESGRTREEAKLLRNFYCQTTGQRKPVPSAEQNLVEATGSRDTDELIAAQALLELSVERLLPAALPPPAFNPLHVLADAALIPRSNLLSTQTSNQPETYNHPPSSNAEHVIAIHEEDTAKINEDLESTRALCVEKCSSNTQKCVEHAKEVRSLWRKYYTTIRSGSWASYRSPEYVFEMRRLFDTKSEIQKIHARAAKELRLHYKDALCTIRFNDDPAVKKYKQEAAAMFDGIVPELQIHDFIRRKELEVKEERSPKQLEYDSRLASCKSEEQKRAVYQEDACTPMGGDTKAMAKLRLRWLGLFNGNMPYIDIYPIIQKDVTDYMRMERELREKLDGLQRAKAAHDKAEIAKEAKKAAKEISIYVQMLSKYTFYCTTEGCQNLSVPISQDEGNLECGICNHLAHNDIIRTRSYFCSEECMERDGRTHINKAHSCAAAAACTTGVFNRGVHEKYCGVCIDCWKFFGIESYFCSNECRTKNWTEHCNQRHVQLRAQLVEKLENDKDFFQEWKNKMHLTEEEVRKALMGVSFPTDSNRLTIRTSASPK